MALAAFVLGITFGLIVLLTMGRARGTAPELGGWTLALGVSAAVAFVVTGAIQALPEIALTAGLASIALAFAGVLVGVGGLLRGVRRWPLWVGLALAGAPALAWLAFLVGSLQAP